MRPRDAGIFALGFSAGLLSVTLGLWASGSLRATYADAGAARAMSGPPEPAPDLRDFSQPHPQLQPQPSLAALPKPETFVSGEADRIAPDPTAPKLGMPIRGLSAGSLSDSFSQTRGSHQHEALDLPSPRGTPVVAVAEGNVAKLFNSKQGGLTVYQFDDAGVWCYYYAHLDHYASSLKEGMLLRKGDVLGYVGNTGDARSTAPHLHFAVFRLGPEKQWWKGTAVDPLPLLK